MARQRFIWPTIWEDPDFGRLSHGARLLYIACFSNADDEGRLIGDPAHLRSIAFRYDEVSLEHVRDLRRQVAETCGRYLVYAVGGIEYVAFLNWGEFQKPKYPKISKHPKPPKISTGNSGKLPEDPIGIKPNADAGLNSGKLPEALGEASPIGLGWVGLDRTPLPPSPKGDDDLTSSLTPRGNGTNPRAEAQRAKRAATFGEYVHRFWDEYPDTAILVDELCDRGCARADAEALVERERSRRVPA